MTETSYDDYAGARASAEERHVPMFRKNVRGAQHARRAETRHRRTYTLVGAALAALLSIGMFSTPALAADSGTQTGLSSLSAGASPKATPQPRDAAPLAQAASGGMFNCQSGNIYSMQSNGDIKQIDSDGAVTTIYSAIGQTKMSSANGLGINTDGSVAYWYERTGQQAQNISKLVKYSSSDSNSPSAITNSGYTSGSSTSLVTGVIDSSNRFLFASFNNSQISLWQGAASGYKSLGYAQPQSKQQSWPWRLEDDLPSGQLNGDMAFDSLGNLYVVSSTDPDRTGNVTVNITLIKKGDIDKAIAGTGSSPIPSSTVSTKTIKADSGFNGIAFDADGYVYVGNGTTLLKYDSASWALKATVVTGKGGSTLGASTDLSSCSTPPTLEVDKNLPSGRAVSDDQFTLNIADLTGVLASETTTGNASGIQSDTAGPKPVVAGNQYLVSEAAGSDSTDLSKYTSSLACVDTANNNATVAVDSSGRLTIPKGAAKPPSVVCTFTNTPKPGNVQWAKQDSATGATLSGSEWKITGPSPSTQNLAVTDCVGSSVAACSGTNDVNFQAGQFEVQGLAPGSYTLTETKAPAGYSLDSTLRPFTVSAGATVDLKAISNTKLPVATVTVSKTVQDVNGQNGKPAAGWSMSSVLTANPPSGQNPTGVAITPSGTQNTAGTNGATPPWTVTYPSASAEASATVAETQQAGYDFVSGKCTITPQSGSASEVSWTDKVSHVISGIYPGDTVACNFINKQKPGSVTWSKTDDGGHSLSGSEWTLTPTDPAGAAVTVTDNIGQPGYTGLDTDSAAGKFAVGALKWGKYTLQESKAPAGYVPSTTTYPFEITATGLTATVNSGNAIRNTQQTPPLLPLTGGLSTDAFMFAGGGLLAAAGVGEWFRRRRRRLSPR